jgi:hypothetical protein
MGTDGFFGVTNSHGQGLWSAPGSGNNAAMPGSYLAVQNDGNLVVYAPNGGPSIWSSNSNPYDDTGCPGP